MLQVWAEKYATAAEMGRRSVRGCIVWEGRLGRGEAMKASVLHEYGGPDKLQYEDFPDPKLGEGEVLVRVAGASINPVDYKMRSGEAKARFPVAFPGVLGRDLAGVVREVGPGVTGFEPGDQVMALTQATYAELAAVKASDLAKVPEGLELTAAATLPLVVATGDQLIRKACALAAGQTVLVAGALGSVGRVAVYAALTAGAKVIAGVRKKQVDEAKGLGAMEVVALDDEDAMSEVGLLDAVADTVGGKTATTLLGKVKQGGVFGTLLGPPAGADMHPTVRVAAMMAEPDPATLVRYAEAIRDKRFAVPVDRLLPLRDAGEGQAIAEKGGVGKIVLVP